MLTGWKYRVLSLLGTGILTGIALWFTNLPTVQEASMVIPLYNRLNPTTVSSAEFQHDLLMTLAAVLAAMVPLYRPRPRRVLDTIALVIQRVFVAMVALAAVGYFDYTYRLPRTTLVLTTMLLFVLLPLWFVTIRSRPVGSAERAVIVGDDPDVMETILRETDLPIIGYVSSTRANVRFDEPTPRPTVRPDGGNLDASNLWELENLGGLSRLDEVIVKHDIDTAILAFSRPDRAEFFGALYACYEHGVRAKVHRDHADSVLTTDIEAGDLIDIDLDPWSWRTYIVKRAFDIAFSAVGLLVLAPVMGLIALAIKLDDGGPILYRQRRTASFGEAFTVAKFRSMEPTKDDVASLEDVNQDRVTRVGRFLRKTHLDEAPQLWSVLIGNMSVVGPRATWTDEERLLEAESQSWRKRWFVKPGLTGMAQINGVTSTDPEGKLRYDIIYIRNQSLWFDLKIVVRQLWHVGVDVLRMIVPG